MLGRWGCTFEVVLPESSFRPGRGHGEVLAVAVCLLGLSYGNFFAGWCSFTTSFLCVSTQEGLSCPQEMILKELSISWENS